MIDRTTTVAQAVADYLRKGQTLMIGGFGRGGVPFTLIDAIAARKDHLTELVVIKNDANEPDIGIDWLFQNGQVARMVATHIGLNPDFIQRMNDGEIETELMPQGIFAERIRAGGAGIPAILTDIGMGTEVAEGKPTVDLDGTTYLIERAMRGDVGLICADVVDRTGNCWFEGSNRNMCVVMGTACDRVIVEAKTIVDIGAIRPEDVHLPGVFVDAVVPAEPRRHMQEASAQGSESE